MNASIVDFPVPGITLSCVICGGQATLASELQALLERSARVGSIEALSDALTLRHALALRPIDVVLHVLDTPDEALPRCLLDHPQVRVLVVAPDGVRGTLSHWLQQGANDLVSPDDEAGLSHAISRLLDECGLLASLRRQQTVIDTQRRRIDALTSSLLPADVRTTSDDAATDTAIPLRAEGGTLRGRRSVSSRDGLPGRRQTLHQLQVLATRAAGDLDEPAVAVRLAFPFDERCASRLENTLCDLAICRAVTAMRRSFPDRLLLGRLRSDSLLMLVPARDESAARDTEITLRRSLGTLGELLERPDELTIQTLHGPLSDVSTSNLESDFDQERNATVAVDMTGSLLPLPILTERCDTFSPALAVGQS